MEPGGGGGGDNGQPAVDPEEVKRTVNAKMKALRELADRSKKDLGLHYESLNV
jgi:hypothetical protein